MIKIIVLAILISFTYSCEAQVYKFKAFNTYFKYYDEGGNPIKTGDSVSVDFLVVMNFAKNKINTYGKQEGNMDLVETIEDITDVEGNIERIYNGIDQFGEKCQVYMKFYKSGHESDCIMFFYYTGPGVAMVYRLKKDL